jgi:hypothetical protein
MSPQAPIAQVARPVAGGVEDTSVRLDERDLSKVGESILRLARLAVAAHLAAAARAQAEGRA